MDSKLWQLFGKEMMLFEIINKDKLWINVGWGFFISCITKFGHFNKIVHCKGTFLGPAYYKNPSLRGNGYICMIYDTHGLYMSALYVDPYPKITTNPVGHHYLLHLLVLPSTVKAKMEW